MAKVQIEGILEKLDREVRRSLEDAVREQHSNVSFDYSTLCRSFIRSMYRHCSKWERVPDRFVELD